MTRDGAWFTCYPEVSMAVGTVKWFNPQKGYGFIQPEGGGKDVFVHISAVQKAGIGTLNEGQRVSFELEQSQQGKTSAADLKLL
jgi:cold shock protein